MTSSCTRCGLSLWEGKPANNKENNGVVDLSRIFFKNIIQKNILQFVIYCQVSNIRLTWVGNQIVDHSDVVGASPVGAAPTTSSFSTEHLASIYCAKTTASEVEKHLSLGFGAPYIRDFTVILVSAADRFPASTERNKSWHVFMDFLACFRKYTPSHRTRYNL